MLVLPRLAVPQAQGLLVGPLIPCFPLRTIGTSSVPPPFYPANAVLIRDSFQCYSIGRSPLLERVAPGIVVSMVLPSTPTPAFHIAR